MIQSRADLELYLEEDRKALGRKESRPYFFGDEIWKFQRSLRRLEYLTNSKNSLLGKIQRQLEKYRFHRLSLQCGYSIPCNVFGPGLAIVHRGTIIVNRNARIGRGCRIHTCVNIGASGGAKRAPKIGNYVYIAPGAKIFGDIEIADNIAIGANAVVNSSFSEAGITIAGAPARKVSDKGSEFVSYNYAVGH